MFRRFLFFVLFVSAFLTGLAAHAQQIASDKEKGMENFKKLDYSQAIVYYERLAKKRETPEVIRKLAECYRQVRSYQKAELWYKKVISLKNAAPLDFFYYADALENNGKYLLAASYYKNLNYLSVEQKLLAEKRVQSCLKADSIEQALNSFIVHNQENLNTSFSDFGLIPYGAGYLLVSDRVKNEPENADKEDYYRTYGWTNHAYLKLFLFASPEKSKDSTIILFDSIPGRKFHIGPVVLNKTEDTMYFSTTNLVKPQTLTNDKDKIYHFVNRLEIYYSAKSHGQWKQAVPFPYNKVTDYSMSHPAISRDGHYLYFASDKPGGIGGVDLYYCEILGNGNFGEPINLGSKINTEGDEEFPVIQPNGDLYFSSNGHAGLGGLDIFRASGAAVTWSDPENMGSPVNSNKDDFEFMLTRADSTNGFLSSNREGGKGGDDIYRFSNFPIPINSILQNTINEAFQKMLLRRKILEELKRDETERSRMNAEEEADRANGVRGMENRFLLRNLSNAFDQYELNLNEKSAIDSNILYMLGHPNARLSISGHTDNKGSDKYNDELSKKRAQTAFDYMVAHGIDPGRLEMHAYGKRRPVEPCLNCTIEEDEINRQTQFEFIDMAKQELGKKKKYISEAEATQKQGRQDKINPSYEPLPPAKTEPSKVTSTPEPPKLAQKVKPLQAVKEKPVHGLDSVSKVEINTPDSLRMRPPKMQQIAPKAINPQDDGGMEDAFGEMEISAITLTSRNQLILKETDGTLEQVILPKEALEADLVIKDKAGHIWIIKKDRRVIKLNKIEGQDANQTDQQSPASQTTRPGAQKQSPSDQNQQDQNQQDQSRQDQPIPAAPAGPLK